MLHFSFFRKRKIDDSLFAGFRYRCDNYFCHASWSCIYGASFESLCLDLTTIYHIEFRRKGATIVSNISKKIDIVLAGSDAGEKLIKAEDLGIEVLDEG